MLSYVYQGRNSLAQPIEYNHWPRGTQAWLQPVAALENCWLNCTTSINSTDCCWKKLAFSLQVQIPKSQRDAHPSQAVLICFPGKFAFLLFLLSFSFLLFSNPVALSQPCPHIPQGKLIFHWETCRQEIHLFTIESPDFPGSVHLLCVSPSFMLEETSLLCERLLPPCKLWILLPLILSDVIPESSWLPLLSSVSPPLAYSHQCKNMLYCSSFKNLFLVFLFSFNYH